MTDNRYDGQQRRNIIWITFTIAFVTILSGFIIERALSYDLRTYPSLKFGHFGFQLAQIPSKKEIGNKKSIVLLGNSVYQYNNIPKYMQQITNELNNPIVFMNMAQVSSSIYDYLAHAARIVNTHPDMVVICMNEGTFSFDPRFKTDSDQIVFNPDVLKNLSAAFYFRYFTYQTATETALSTVIPLKRVDSILRYTFGLRQWLPAWFLNGLSYPYDMNIPAHCNVKAIQMTELKKTAGEEKFIVLQEVLGIFQKYKIPVLFIWQEASVQGDPVLYARIKKIIEGSDNAIFVDLTSYWSKGTFIDTIHPNQEEEPRYAFRHYLVASKALSFFEHKGSVR